jgi:hypothetical protein
MSDGMARDDEDRTAAVHNEAEGGHRNNYVQAGRIDGGVHFYQVRGEECSDIEHPVIATVELRPGARLVDLVVDDEPPRAMTPSGTIHVVTLEARTERAVILNAVRPVVLSRRLPRPACCTARIGAKINPRRFTTDFNADPPKLRAVGPDFPFTISATDVEQFWFEPVVRAAEVRWQLELDWICAGHRGSTVVNNNGKPFEIYPVDALYTDDGGHSVLHSGCGSSRHEPDCPAVRLEARLPGAAHNTFGPVISQ